MSINFGVGWGATALGGSADLKQVAFEGRNPTQKILGFVRFHFIQPNLHFFLSLELEKSVKLG
ncbi:MAG: hypothetical protein V7L05_25665 [Nostoc sp.]|uniref:hypothetical protein n=1 Tax=Nostoc sp. TaxID=1180 RepID=UPI002FF8255C